MQSELGFEGKLKAKKLKGHWKRPAPRSWRIRQALRPDAIWGYLTVEAAKRFSKITGIPTITSELRAVKRHANGLIEDFGVVSRRVVTTAGVNFLVDDWDDDSTDITTMNYHGSGTGTTAAVIGDTALETELTTDLNPNNTRATGTKSQPSANILQSVGTCNYDPASTTAVTEHGILSQAATGGGSLWDRHVFSAINVDSGDSIEFTYQCTINAGG